MKKSLVVYFSKTGENYGVGIINEGNTAVFAKDIHELVDNSDIYEIIPTNPYPESYKESIALSQVEFKNKLRPEIKNPLKSVDEYQTIYLGFPIWYGVCPNIILTFLDSFNFENKTIVPFTTSEGSSINNAMKFVRDYLPKSKVVDGLNIFGHKIHETESKEDIKNWLTKLDA